jgi:HTH-type transcriptional regulator / antitoxin HipB
MALKKTVLEELSGIIRHRRRALGLTQKELGERLGIDQRTVSSLEKNPGSVSAARFFAVIAALELDLYTSSDPRDSVLISRLSVDASDPFGRNADRAVVRNIRTA